jgi:hypothetical protein
MKSMRYAWVLALLLVSLSRAGDVLDEKIPITRREFLEFKICSYLSGFKKFDTSLNIVDNTIVIRIYLFPEEDKKYADLLLSQWKRYVTVMLSHYDWAKRLEIKTELFSVDKRL